MNDRKKYIDEMMRFYAQNPQASVGDISGEKEESPAVDALAVEEELPESAPEPIEEENCDGQTFEERFPMPVIPDYIRGGESMEGDDDIPVTEIVPEESGSDENTEYGFLKVEVRTAENGLPVAGASVTVTDKEGKIVFSGISDESGELGRIELPAPHNSKGGTPESFSSYEVYTASVYMDGFYRGVSVDVPVFSGITSIQRFSLIPLPYDYSDGGRSISNLNTEPAV